ncbi:MAG TPA: GNAT family N-acetyltransferase [Solirubrobacterales bacterium]|jgi:GNAT superfamily N-acetyltransferase
MPPFWRHLAEGTGGSVWEQEGVLAALVPSSPKRSFFNSVLYEDSDRMIESIDVLAEVYAGAGVEAWTVWVPEQDVEVARALEAAGHELDATPRAMAMPLGELKAPEPDRGLEIREVTDFELVSKLNEIAYGYAPGDFPPIRGEQASMRTYFGAVDGETLGCAGAFAHGTDCEIVYVAVLPEGRGRGISGRLMARALEDAREQGLETTTLQATKLGYPVYVKLGYTDYGTLQMWERRDDS